MSPSPDAPRPPGRVRPLALVGALLLLPLSALVLLLAVFAVSPTTCPDAGGPVLCRHPALGSVVLAGVALALLLALALAFTSSLVHTTRTAVLCGVGALIALVVAGVVAVLAGSSW